MARKNRPSRPRQGSYHRNGRQVTHNYESPFANSPFESTDDTDNPDDNRHAREW